MNSGRQHTDYATVLVAYCRVVTKEATMNSGRQHGPLLEGAEAPSFLVTKEATMNSGRQQATKASFLSSLNSTLRYKRSHNE